MLITCLGSFQGKGLSHKMDGGSCLLGLDTTPSITHCYGLGSPVDANYVPNCRLDCYIGLARFGTAGK